MKESTLQIIKPLLQSDETITANQIEQVIGILVGAVSKPREAPEPYMTLKEAARKLNISACSLWRWRVPGHDFGGRRKFRISEIEAYLETDEFKERAKELRAEYRASARAIKRRKGGCE